jgi:C4-dicarboxylate-specific signal transduction histidine kinase
MLGKLTWSAIPLNDPLPLITAMVVLAVIVIAVTNRWLSERFTETTRNRAELRLALYSGNMLSEVQRTSVVPLLLADDPAIRDALLKNSFADTTLRLIEVQKELRKQKVDSERAIAEMAKELKQLKSQSQAK